MRHLPFLAFLAFLAFSFPANAANHAEWNCKPTGGAGEGAFTLVFDGQAPLATLFGETDSKGPGDDKDGLTVKNTAKGESPIYYNDETEVRESEVPFDVPGWGNNLPTNKNGIQYTLVLPGEIKAAKSFPASLWKEGPQPFKMKYVCSSGPGK
jgi:hypothetical protein